MSEMVKRVARAIALGMGENPDENVGSLLDENKVIWQDYEKAARSAIEALRVPTEAMLKEGAGVGDGNDDYAIGERAAGDAWQAMIDAALTSSPAAKAERQ